MSVCRLSAGTRLTVTILFLTHAFELLSSLNLACQWLRVSTPEHTPPSRPHLITLQSTTLSRCPRQRPTAAPNQSVCCWYPGDTRGHNHSTYLQSHHTPDRVIIVPTAFRLVCVCFIAKNLAVAMSTLLMLYSYYRCCGRGHGCRHDVSYRRWSRCGRCARVWPLAMACGRWDWGGVLWCADVLKHIPRRDRYIDQDANDTGTNQDTGREKNEHRSFKFQKVVRVG